MHTIKLILTLILVLLFVSLRSQNCTVNAGIDQSNCETLPGQLTGNASGLFSIAAHWILVSGPSLQITNPDSLKTTFSGYTGGNVYKFKIAATCEDGAKVEDMVTIKISSMPDTPNAGPNQTQCTLNGLSVNLSASMLNSSEIGFWEIIKGGSGTFSDSLSPTSKFTLVGNNCISTTNIVLRWNVISGSCNTFDDVTITYYGGAPVDAGPHQNITCANSVKLAALCPGQDKQVGLWTLLNGPGGGTLGNPNSNTSTLGDLKIGTYLLKWSVSGPCVSNEDTVSITILSLGIETKVSTSPNQNVCVENLPTYFNIHVTSPDSGLTGVWSQTTGTATSIANKYASATTIAGIETPGTYSYKWLLTSGSCSTSAMVKITVVPKPYADAGPDIIAPCAASIATMTPKTAGGTWTFIHGPSIPTVAGNKVSKLFKTGIYAMKYSYTNPCGQVDDTATITVSAPPSNSNAGTDQLFACNVITGTLAANTPSSGIGRWSQISGPSIADIADIHSPSSNLSDLIGGRYYFKWEIDGGSGCAIASDEVIIYVSTSPPTYANAGPDQTISKNTPLILMGNKPSMQEIGTWNQVSGMPVGIDSPNSELTHITNIQENNTYRFVWSINNSCGSSFDTVQVTVIPDSKVGSDSKYCNASIIDLYGSYPVGGTGLWSQVSGPPCTIENISSPITSVRDLIPGIYKFNWATTIGGHTKNSTMTITNYNPVEADAGKHQDIVNESQVILNGNSPKQGYGTWSLVSGVGAKIKSPGSPTTLVTGLSTGEYKFRWTVTNGLCVEYSDVSILVTEDNDSQTHSITLISESSPTIYLPNAFTPNEDGLNDRFKPTISGIDRYTMVLFNRWGQQVYRGSERDEGWDGKYRDKECQQEVYVYQLVYEGKKSNNVVVGETLNGTVTLLR